MSVAPFSWLSIMTVASHYKDIMRFHTELGWQMVYLTCCLSLFISLSLYVCVCELPFHSEANHFRGGATLCECADLHVWQAASANLHCLRVAHANHHLALATVSIRPQPYRVSHHPPPLPEMFKLDFLCSCSIIDPILRK